MFCLTYTVSERTAQLSVSCKNNRESNSKCEQEFRTAVYSEIVQNIDGTLSFINPHHADIFNKDGHRLNTIYMQSLHFVIFCPTVSSLYKLVDKMAELYNHFHRIVRFEELKSQYNMEHMELNIDIDPESVHLCLKDILTHQPQGKFLLQLYI